MKPLYYLREGKIFVFDLPADAAGKADGQSIHRMEHFWLCGPCSETLNLKRTDGGIELSPKRRPMMAS